MLIDTGAAISIIRKDKISNNLINNKNKVYIIGVSDSGNTIRTHGTTELSLDSFPKHKINVADIIIEADS
jgi:hypothetical protein